jgi:hypothetical protein
MSIRLHKKLNLTLYLICLLWGGWTLINLFNQMYTILFTSSFIYSCLLNCYYKTVNKAIEKNIKNTTLI